MGAAAHVVGLGQLRHGNAHVELPEGTEVDDAIATVEATGYRAWLPATAGRVDGQGAAQPGPEADPEDVEVRSLRQRLNVSAALTVPVLAMAMIPAVQFTYWQWLSLTLAAPVVVWGGGRFTGPPGPTCATARRPWTR